MKMLFLHGAGGTGTAFSNQIAEFAGAEAMVLPGHGDGGDGPDSIGGFAGAVAARLDALDWSDVLLCGHSMGGAIALETALRGNSRIAGVVAIGSGARMRVAPAFLEAMERDFPAAARTFASSFFARAGQADVDAAVATMLEVGAARTLRDLRAVDAFDVTARLSELSVPLLAITGERDVLTPPKYALFLADRVPAGEARIVADAGHFVMMERPEETNAAIRAFADRIADR